MIVSMISFSCLTMFPHPTQGMCGRESLLQWCWGLGYTEDVWLLRLLDIKHMSEWVSCGHNFPELQDTPSPPLLPCMHVRLESVFNSPILVGLCSHSYPGLAAVQETLRPLGLGLGQGLGRGGDGGT